MNAPPRRQATPDPDGPRIREQQRQLTVLKRVAEHEIRRLHQGQKPWASWLTQADLHGRYGFANTLLIPLQRPSATEVRTHDGWQKNGRQVRKDETGIRILSRRDVVYSVFDRDQTEGAGSDRLSGNGADHQPPPNSEEVLERLVQLARHFDFYVDRGTAWTYLGRPERRILIPGDLDPSAATGLLAHQLAHALQSGEQLDPEHGTACRGVRRVRADSIAHLVLAKLNADTSQLAFVPVASWTGGDPRALPLSAIQAVGTHILKTAGQIRRHLEQPSPPLTSPRPTAASSAAASSTPSTAAAQPTSAPAPTRVPEALAAAHEFFQAQCPGSWVPGYLTLRGFPGDVPRSWQIGYAPKNGQALLDHLRAAGFADSAIESAGLTHRRNGVLSPLFHDRLMLPLRDADGAVAGFIGRRSDAARGPKYINSPATNLFQKSQTLFGLPEGRGQLAAGARPLIVEGPLDAIAVNASRPESYVAFAPCGTALTADHLKLLERHTSLDEVGIALALDGDQAGQRAALRTWKHLRRITGPVEAIVLADGRDPADLLRHGGPEIVRKSLQSVVQLADLVIDAEIERSRGTLDFAEVRLAAARSAANLIAHMPPAQVARQVNRVAAATGVPTAEVTNALTTALSHAELPAPLTVAGEDIAAPSLEPSSPPDAAANRSPLPPPSAKPTRNP